MIKMPETLSEKLLIIFLVFLLYTIAIIAFANSYPIFSIVFSILGLISSLGFLIYQTIEKRLKINNFYKKPNLYGFIPFCISISLIFPAYLVIENQNNIKREEYLKKIDQEKQAQLQEKIKKEEEKQKKEIFEQKINIARSMFSKKDFENCYLTYKDAITFGTLNEKDTEIFVSLISEKAKKNLEKQDTIQAKEELKLILSISPNDEFAKNKMGIIWAEEQIIAEQNKKTEDSRKLIFYELAKLQDQGGNDPQNSENAQYVIAERYGITRDEVLKIMVEGVKNDWPMPDPP